MTTAKQIIASKLPFADNIKDSWAQEIINALAAAGYSITATSEMTLQVGKEPTLAECPSGKTNTEQESNDGLLTRPEVAKIFGGYVPREAIDLIWNSPNDLTLAELRRQLRQMARDLDEANAEGLAMLKGWTYVIQYNSNCPSPFLVRLPGRSGFIDLKSYSGGPAGVGDHRTGDVLGFGRTLKEAAASAVETAEEARKEWLTN